MRVRLLARHFGRTQGGGGPQRGDRMLRRLTSGGCGPGEIGGQSAAGGRIRSGSGAAGRGGAGQGGNAATGAPDRGRSLALGRPAALRAAGCLASGPAPPPDPAPTAWRACSCGCAVNKASLPGRPLATEEGFSRLVPPRTWAAAAESSGFSGLLLPKLRLESPR